MRVTGLFCLLVGCLTSAAFAQGSGPHPIQIFGGFGASGVLQWSNSIPTTQPVYEIMRGNTVMGAWTAGVFVTNQHSAVVTNSLAGAGQVFHRVRWVNDTSTRFDYVFDEGYGVPAVIGQLNLTFVTGPNLGTWLCAEYLSVDERHPTGTGNFVGGGITVTPTNHLVRLVFTPLVADSGVYLEGVMQLGTQSGRAIYTGFSGTVYENGFAGPSSIGTFTATRSQ